MEHHYKKLRNDAYRATERLFTARLTEIDAKAVAASHKHGFTWAWDDDANAHLASRFEVAVWEHEGLTGLCRGKPININDSGLALEIVEAAPDIPLAKRSHVLPIVDVCAEVYASLIGATEIRLMEPTSTSRIRLYAMMGYKHIPSGNYLVKKV